MKIDLIKINVKEHSTYKYKPLQYCCNALKNNECVNMCMDDIYVNGYVQDDDEEDFPTLCTTYLYEVGDWEDTWTMAKNYSMNFCPHCGQPINLEVIAEEDHGQEVDILETERESIFKKIRITDSKSKTEELNKQLQMINKRINDLYDFGEYQS